jgi:hypothetical protein
LQIETVSGQRYRPKKIWLTQSQGLRGLKAGRCLALAEDLVALETWRSGGEIANLK